MPITFQDLIPIVEKKQREFFDNEIQKPLFVWMVIMNFRNWNGILSFDEIAFPREPSVGIMVI
jgi:hypothetical protein